MSKLNFKITVFILIFSSLNVFPQTTQQLCKKRLSQSINSYQPAIIPVVSIDGGTLYFDRKIHPENIGGVKDKDDIWFSKRIDGDVWSEPKNAGGQINTFDSDVLFSISPDMSQYLVYGIYDENGKKSPGFSITYPSETGWHKPVQLKIKNFYNDSNNYFGNLSADGKFLLLAVHRNDSYGDLDLYVSFKTGENEYSEPKNLGNVINSNGLEGSPFLGYDNKTLYFSSNGHGGFGNLDLFMSRRLDNSWTNWSKPVNLGKNINSPANENSIWLTALSDTAYIVSYDTATKREGIYFVCMPDSLMPNSYAILRGSIYKDVAGTLSAFKSEVSIKINNDSDTDETVFHNVKGTNKYFHVLDSGKFYSLFFNAPDFKETGFSVSTRNLKNIMLIDYNANISPVPPKELLETIHFDTNVDELTPDEKAKLSFIVNKLFDPKDTKLIVIGHTDEVGSDTDNMLLSIRRAKNTALFLEELGFKASNIRIEGKGKTQPKSDKHEENRRAEIYSDN